MGSVGEQVQPRWAQPCTPRKPVARPAAAGGWAIGPPGHQLMGGVLVCLPFQSHLRKNPPTPSSSTSMAAVVGNPKLPSAVMDRWLWGPMPSAEEEAYMVSELLGCQPLVGSVATKERVMSALTQAECVHFATHISWKLSALVLTPSADGNPASSKSSFGHPYTIPESLRVQDDASDGDSISDCPPLQELLLTAADVLDLRLPVKLVVLGSSQESNSKVTADGVIALSRAFLAAGAQCVLVSLWPVPVAASKMLLHTLYSSLLNGLKASAALGEAMKAVQSSKAFSHPSNWAGRSAGTRQRPRARPLQPPGEGGAGPWGGAGRGLCLPRLRPPASLPFTTRY